jgi:hypothetical protein
VDAKEPVYNAHKVDLAALSKKPTEKSFDCRIFGKINKAIRDQEKEENLVVRQKDWKG